MNRSLRALFNTIISFLQVQLFISLASLPVLVAWGLPISLMTIVGNCIFSPFIAAFLLCASLIFFSELMHIPNGMLIQILEWITQFWLYCLSFGSKTWLISLPFSSLPLLIIIACTAAITLTHKKLGSGLFYIMLCGCLLLSAFVARSYTRYAQHADIMCVKKHVSIVNDNGKLHLIDHGGLGERRNPSSWVSYTLIPTLTKLFGTTDIDCVTVRDNTRSTQKALEALEKETVVKKITNNCFI